MKRPRLWTPDDEDAVEPALMVGTMYGIREEEPEEPEPPRLVLPDGRAIPRRSIGFRPPEKANR